MIRIGIDTRDLKNAKTGIKTWLTEIIRVLETNPQVKLIKLDSLHGVYNGNNYVLKIIEHFKLYWYKEIQLPLLAHKNKCTWVISSNYISPILKINFKTLVVLHDAFFWEYPSHYNKFWLGIFKVIGIIGIKRADLIITPSEYSKKRIMHFLHLNEDKINVIYEAAKEFPKPQKIRPINAPYILHIGVLEKRKNLPNLIKGFQLISNKYPNLNLILAGNTPNKRKINDEAEILKTINKTGLDKRIHILGYVNEQKASDLFSYAEGYIFPSYNEGFGLPILEAFQFGIPVAVANNTALPEIGRNAVLKFNPFEIEEIAEAIECLISDKKKKQELISKGYEVSKGYSWEKAGEDILDLIINKN